MYDLVMDAVLSAFAIYLASKVFKGVRCESFLDAAKVAALFAVLNNAVMMAVTKLGLLSMLVATVFVPIFGPWASLGLGFVLAFVICAVSLRVADHLVEGFEISSFPMTVAVVVGVVIFIIPIKLGLALATNIRVS